MRTMYDGVTPTRLPKTGAQLIAGYVDGPYRASYPQDLELFPKLVHVAICIDPAHDAQVLDVERYDARPDQAPGWAVRQRARGQVPTIYCNTSTWPAVKAEFARQHVPLALWWAAKYDGVATLPAGAIAKQYHNTPGYDVSVVADFWPGIDKGPAPKPSPKPPAGTTYTVKHGDTLSGIAAMWHVTLSALEHANPHAGHPAGNFGNIWPGDVIHHP